MDFALPESLTDYLAELDASAAFDSFATAPLVGWPRTARSTDRLWRIADGFETVQALQAARTASSTARSWPGMILSLMRR